MLTYFLYVTNHFCVLCCCVAAGCPGLADPTGDWRRKTTEKKAGRPTAHVARINNLYVCVFFVLQVDVDWQRCS